MRYRERRLATRLAVERVEQRLLAGGTVSDADILMLTKSLYSGRWIGIDHYRLLQQRLQGLKPQRAAVVEAISAVLNKGYHHWLRCFQAHRLALAPGLAYKVDHIPKTTPNKRRPGEKMSPKFLTIHSTGNPSSMGTGERNWLTSAENTRTASFHVVVDEKQAVECIPFDEVAWHAGDGNGDGNKKSISLEICESGDRTRTLRNAIALAARILREQDLAPTSLRRHHDWATKMCPRILIVPANRRQSSQTWEWFQSEVTQLV